jgi:hypothetical protein
MFEFKGLQLKEASRASIGDYASLLSQSFVGFKPSVAYLNWLYFENPKGDVKGFDAFDGTKLVGHYACIPIKINGYKSDSLLSLNTATHPDYQGRGLFSALASKTFDSVSTTYANVIGVANAKSIGGFVKHLGFEKIGNLDLRFGSLDRPADGGRCYSREELEWRISCPGRRLELSEMGQSNYLVSTRIRRYLPALRAVVPVTPYQGGRAASSSLGMTLDWRRGVEPLLKLPEFLKPSPLALIYKPLLESDSIKLKSFSFPDFDAY